MTEATPPDDVDITAVGSAEEALNQQLDRHQSDSAIAPRDADPPPGNNGHSNGQANGSPPSRNGHQHGKPAAAGEPASNKQVQFLQTLAKRQKLYGPKLDGFIEETIGRICSPYDLTKKEAGAVIDALNPEEAGDNRPRR